LGKKNDSEIDSHPHTQPALESVADDDLVIEAQSAVSGDLSMPPRIAH
jgi:hypothetical protein